MSGFKLIGIRTGNALSKEEIQSFEDFPYSSNSRTIAAPYNYIKNLEPNQNFVFFDDYKLEDDGSILTYLPENSIPDLYVLNKNPKTSLTISTIVGKNGSGKSTLLEILYVAIHNLAVATEVLYDSDMVKVETPQEYLRCQLYILTDQNTSYRLCFDNKAPNPCVISKSTIKKNIFNYEEIVNFDKSILENLFYSIAVNYSIYGLNSKSLGNWITHLFHKNDSYQTPLVINPMRTEGNFDINREEYLSKYRLLSNSVLKFRTYRDVFYLIEKLKIKNLIFKLDQNKIKYLETKRLFKDSSKNRETYEQTRTIRQLIDESKLERSISNIAEAAVGAILQKKVSLEEIPYKIEAEKYIVKKLYRIAFNYNRYWNYIIHKNTQINITDYPVPVMFETIFKKDSFEEYLLELSKDKTHVTLKLRQALNYLVNNPLKKIKLEDGSIANEFKSIVGGKVYEIQFIDFAKNILDYDDEVIRCIPPSLFDIAVIVSDESKEESNDFDMRYLSSGQLQLIHSIQSSLYHINNLESYKEVEDDQIKYENVLILLDEIELYFHPEYQRRMVEFFIKQLDELNFVQIKSFHLIYITHSPFILSDIPSQNILRLKDGKPQKANYEEQTFGANIYDLLDNEFFMEDGFIGSQAMLKIKEVLDYLGDKQYDELKHNYFLSIVKIIGDEIINQKLNQLLNDLYINSIDENQRKIIQLKLKQKQIEDELKRLEE